MYYSDGRGFMVLRGDATRPDPGEHWLPLCFEHDQRDNYSSYLTNAKEQPALYCWRADQAWVRMLLPDVYHGSNRVSQVPYGALKGDLPIFLSLVAFSMSVNEVESYLPSMFQHGRWQVYGMANGRMLTGPSYTATLLANDLQVAMGAASRSKSTRTRAPGAHPQETSRGMRMDKPANTTCSA